MAPFNQMTKSDHVFVFPCDEAAVDVASNGKYSGSQQQLQQKDTQSGKTGVRKLFVIVAEGKPRSLRLRC